MSIDASMIADPEIAGRLRLARIKAGYESAAKAARALGMKSATYVHHENGTRGLLDNAPDYASIFGISLEWLLTGRGSMNGSAAIEVRGQIGIGEKIDFDHNVGEMGRALALELPRPRNAEAFIVRGDTMQPRFYSGEALIFESRPTPPERLLNQICRIELSDDSTFVKILRRSGAKWRLQSIRISEPELEDVDIARAFRWVALLPSRQIETLMLSFPVLPPDA